MGLSRARRLALSIGWWRKWLLPALLTVAVLHTATYARFERTRTTVLSAVRAPVDGAVSLSLPEAAGRKPPLSVLILRLQNRSSAPVRLRVAVGGSEVARPLVPASRTRRFDVTLPDAAARRLSGHLEIAGPGDWALEYVEVANLHGYSSGIMSFVVLPAGSGEYARPAPANRWLTTVVLLVLGALQRSGRRRGGRLLHLTLAAIVATFLGLVLLAPLAAGFSVVLSFRTLLLCAALVHYPVVMQVYRGSLKPFLTRNYRAEAAPGEAEREADLLPERPVASRGLLFAAGLAVAAASVLVIAAIVRAMEHLFVASDVSFLCIYTRLALDGQLLVGAYSRLHWHHPGPVYFYILTPLFWLTDEQPHSFAWTVSLINLYSVWLILSRLKKRGGSGLFAAGGVLVLLYLLQTEWLFVNPWNPFVPMLPLAALIVLSADLASTEHLGALPLVVLFASFITQTHVGYAPCTGAVVLMGLVLHLRCRRHGGVPLLPRTASDRLHLLVSAAVLIVVWALPIVEQLRGDPGNLTFLFHFFRHREDTNVIDALRGYTHYMSALPLWRLKAPWWAGASPGFDWLACSVTAAQIYLLWLASRWASARKRPFHSALCLVSLVGSLAGLWSASRIIGNVHSYLVLWASVLSVTNLTAISAVVTGQGWDYVRMRGRTPADWSRRALPRWLPALLVLAVAGWTLPRLAADQRRSGAGSVGVKTALGEFQSYLTNHGIRRPMLGLTQQVWPFAAGLVFELARAGQSVAIEPRWIYMYTDAFSANGSEDARFEIVEAQQDQAKFRMEYEAVARGGEAEIYRVFPLGPARRLVQSSRVLGATGTRGDSGQTVDGNVPADGSGWDSAGTVVFEGRDASMTLTVPPGATGVALSADGNDSWRLECSSDGSAFELVGIVPVRPGDGLQTREAHFRGLPACQQLRLSPNAGDGMFSVGEVTFLAATVNRGAR